MALKKTEESITDKILRCLGKERQWIVAAEAVRFYNEVSPYARIEGVRESFLSALLRKRKCDQHC